MPTGNNKIDRDAGDVSPDVDASDPGDTTPDATDVDPGDATDGGDVPDMDADDAGDGRDTSDGGDVDGGFDPGEPSLCPERAQESCLFEILSCFGSSITVDACYEDDFTRTITAQYRSGGEATFKFSSDESFRYVDVRSPQGQQCYRGQIDSQTNMATIWKAQTQDVKVYYLEIDEDMVTVTCPDSSTEICSRNRFRSYFAFPTEWPTDCPPFTPNDQCQFDSECEDANTLCCALTEGGHKACNDQEACLVARPPEECDTNSDCGSGKVCRACNYSGTTARECVSQSLDPDNNGLGCVADACTPGAGNCGGNKVCCKVSEIYTCSIESECDDAPDPNPICDPSTVEPCVDDTKTCCHVPALNQFRCLDMAGGSCDTSYCFNDVDCSSNEVCCGANPAQNIAGDCKPSCDGAPVLCTQDSDCFDGIGYCCKYPGYTVGHCMAQETDCVIESCATESCGDPLVCCSAGTGQLTEDVCTLADSCPPDP